MSRIMKFFSYKILIMLLVVLTQTGCWGARELSDIAILAGAGFDIEAEDKFLFTAAIIIPENLKQSGGGGLQGGGSKAGAPVRVSTSTGGTVFRAIRNFIPHGCRRVYFAHSKVLVIGKEASQKGIYPIIDFLIRDPEPRPDMSVLISETKACDSLRVYDGIEKIPALGIDRLIKSNANNGYALHVTLQDFNEMLISETTSAVAPMAEVFEEIGFEQEKTKRLRMTGTAVFKEDKLVGKLELEETRGLLWVMGEVKSAIVDVASFNGEEMVDLEVISASSKITPELIEDGRVIIKVSVSAVSNLGAQQATGDITTPESIAFLQDEQSKAIKQEIMAAIKKAKAYNADIFGFGEAVHRKYPAEWKELKAQWDQIFPEIDVQISVKSKLNGVGSITAPIPNKRY
jgi:spore germination protein KC